MTNYTIGNWTVSDLTTDTVTATKNIAIPDLTYGTDFVKTENTPNEVIISNKTSLDIESPEQIRYAYNIVKDVYKDTDIDVSAQAPLKRGVQVMTELKTKYRATNTINGSTIDLPALGRIVLRFPTYQAVTETMIADLLVRTLSSTFNSTKVNTARVLELARGSLFPVEM